MILSNVISSITNSVRTVKMLCRGNFDVRTAQEITPFGIDSNPIKGMKAIYGTTENNNQGVVLGYVNENLIARPGESRMFSVDSDGNLQAQFYLKGNGLISIGNQNKDLYTLLNNILQHIQELTVTTGTGPSGTPINIADFITDSEDLSELLTS